MKIRGPSQVSLSLSLTCMASASSTAQASPSGDATDEAGVTEAAPAPVDCARADNVPVHVDINHEKTQTQRYYE